MKALISLVYVILLVNSLSGQRYEIIGEQTIYEPLESYGSLMWDTQDNLSGGYRFELPWGFPFFDTTIYHLDHVSRSSIYNISPNSDFEILLFTSIYDFARPQPQGVENLYSDIRYLDTIIESKNVLIVEHTHMRLDSDPSIEEFDSHVNFQSWFWDDGTIDLVFGSCNLDHSPSFIDGEGMKLFVRDAGTGQLDTMDIGPEFRLSNPSNSSEFVSFWSGEDYTDFSIDTTSKGSRILWLPPSGYRYRCRLKQTVSSAAAIIESQGTFYPNPSSGLLIWPNVDESFVHNLTITDVIGKTHAVAMEHNQIDISHLPSGPYILRYTVDGRSVAQQIIKL